MYIIVTKNGYDFGYLPKSYPFFVTIEEYIKERMKSDTENEEIDSIEIFESVESDGKKLVLTYNEFVNKV